MADGEGKSRRVIRKGLIYRLQNFLGLLLGLISFAATIVAIISYFNLFHFVGQFIAPQPTHPIAIATYTPTPTVGATITPIATIVANGQQPVEIFITVPKQSQPSTQQSDNGNFLTIVSLLIAVSGLAVGATQAFFQNRANTLALRDLENRLKERSEL